MTKGIILSGGEATRLRPATYVTSKQLLLVYDKPMIFYPLQTLMMAGIRDILLIVSPQYAGHYVRLLGDGKEWGIKLSYAIQPEPEGLAQAFIIGEGFVGKDNVAMILGDNIFIDNFRDEIRDFKSGGKIFVKKVPDPERFGVAVFNNGKVSKIVEKPQDRISEFAITGLYLYDSRVCEFAKEVKPSERGELEITDLHNRYLELGELDVHEVKGRWLDAGTFDSLLEAGNLMKQVKEAG